MKFRSTSLIFSLAVLFTILFSLQSSAQYFYKDIWNNQQLNKEFSILKNEELRTIIIKSFEDDGSPSEGFFCERRIDKKFSRSETVSRSYMTQQSLLTSFYNDRGWVLKTIDSTETSLSSTEYEYDNKGKIINVKTFTRAGDDMNGITETRQYFYNANGKPEKMVRKKGNAESTVNFTVDEKGNVTDEEEITRGVKGKKYLYYYDDKNRLTDVVHYNENAKRLLPDYMYEYNQQGQIKQLISTEEGGSNYYTWKYTYNDKKLRETETCFSKEKRLMGSITYQYK